MARQQQDAPQVNKAEDTGTVAKALGAYFILQEAGKQALKLGLLSLVLAWLLANTSDSLAINLPVAVCVVLALRWVAMQVDVRIHGDDSRASAVKRDRGGKARAAPSSPGSPPRATTVPAGLAPGQARRDRNAWRRAVGSKIVEFAWERLCNSIVQEWIYDIWFTQMSPDHEFPSEVRALLNNVFGQLCLRASRLDVKATLVRDVAEVIIDNLELYRYTVEAVGADDLRNMTSSARERALQHEMKAEGNLHAALCAPDGHYRVLRRLAEGAVSQLLGPEEGLMRDPLARPLLRELVNTCVLRPIMMYFHPYQINKLALMALNSQQGDGGATPPARKHLEGSQEFERRAQQSAAAEEAAAHAETAAAAAAARHRAAAAAGAGRAGGGGGGAAALSQQHHGSSSFQLDKLERSASLQVRGAKRGGGGGDGGEHGQSLGGGGGGGSDHHHHPGPWVNHSAAPIGRIRMDHNRTRSRSFDEHSFDGMVAALTAVGGHVRDAEAPDLSTSSVVSLHAHGGATGRPRAKDDLSLPASPRSSGHASQSFVFAPLPGARAAGGSAPHSHHSSYSPTPRPPTDDDPLGTLAQGPAGGGQQHRHNNSNTSASQRSGSASASSASSRRPTGDGVSQQAATPASRRQSEASGTMPASGAAGANAFPLPVANPARQQQGAGTSGRGSGPDNGFRGWPRAQVVAPEILTEASKDYVAYKIRVADDSGEWTVTRRYREFEALHKRLKEHPAFRDLGASLPAKRIFIHTHDVAFVNKRRLHLDGYLSQVMGVRELVATTDVWQFLSRDSEVYSAHDQDLQLLAARHAAAASAASSRSGSGAAAPGGGTKVRRRGSGGGGPPMPPVPPPLVRTSAGSFTTAALNGGHAVSDSIAALGLMSPGVYHTPPDSPLLAGGRPWVDSTTSQQQAAAAGRGQSGVSSSGAAAGGLGWGSTGSRPGTDGGLGAPPAGTHSRHQSAASLALFPSDAPAAGGSRGGSFLPPSLPSDSRLPDSASSLASASLSAPWDVPRGGGGGFGDDGGSVAGSGAGDVPPLDSESLLISTPLYDFVDVLFGLQSRGFFRRQVIAMARQLLSLVAGDAIEVYLSNQLKTITAEHTVARFILMLQGALWPGGVWYAWANQQVAPPPPPPTPPPAGKGHRRSLSGPKPRPAPVGLKPEAFLDAAKQPDEKEVARQLRDRLLASAPPALVRLLGQRCYNRSMQDLYDMLQSTTFTQQIGYSILELLLVGLFPELKPLVLSIQQEGGEGGGAAAAMAVARAASAMASAGAQQGL